MPDNNCKYCSGNQVIHGNGLHLSAEQRDNEMLSGPDQVSEHKSEEPQPVQEEGKKLLTSVS